MRERERERETDRKRERELVRRAPLLTVRDAHEFDVFACL